MKDIQCCADVRVAKEVQYVPSLVRFLKHVPMCIREPSPSPSSLALNGGRETTFLCHMQSTFEVAFK